MAWRMWDNWRYPSLLFLSAEWLIKHSVLGKNSSGTLARIIHINGNFETPQLHIVKSQGTKAKKILHLCRSRGIKSLSLEMEFVFHSAEMERVGGEVDSPFIVTALSGSQQSQKSGSEPVLKLHSLFLCSHCPSYCCKLSIYLFVFWK